MIATPADWMVIDFDVLGDRAVIGGLVDQRVEEEPALAPYRDELANIVVRTAEFATKAGVMFCATLASARDDGAPILATLTVATGEQEPPRPNPAGPEAEAANGTREFLVNRIDEPDGSTRFAPVGIELPSGPAARVEHLDDVALFADTSMVCLTIQYLLEVPNAPEQFVALTFTTPSLAYRARLTDLFADIAATFAWAGTGDTSDDRPGA